MNKLIQTNFRYEADWYNGRQVQFGSYLGRKPATEQTIRRFLNGNARKTGAEFRLIRVSIQNSFPSQWIAK